ncbi:unnamed protein product [Moneuplotes crassus]|uniref:Uncharacterized protein n=1 Tax=Euplotes crassus TaxID=5936 RepID=A0AAD1XS25_EUPCR|nr:unnamed protein product [Moneuplotes crassus]
MFHNIPDLTQIACEIRKKWTSREERATFRGRRGACGYEEGWIAGEVLWRVEGG